jgi:dTDP-4-amino-4,6-dideoxygalactose transaminase
VFSFYANKTITTGEGGMLVTRDGELAGRAKVMRLHGMNRDAFDRFTAKVPSWYYEVVAPGFKYNLTDIAAALGIHQLQARARFAAARRSIAARYDAGLADLPVITAAARRPGDLHAWHLYVLRLARCRHGPRRLHRGAVRRRHRLQRALHPAAPAPVLARSLRPARRGLPAQPAAYERMLSLPLYTRMSDADAERVVGALREPAGLTP